MEFKRQTNRSTRQDETENINIFLKGLSFGVVTSNYWEVLTKEIRTLKKLRKVINHTTRKIL